MDRNISLYCGENSLIFVKNALGKKINCHPTKYLIRKDMTIREFLRLLWFRPILSTIGYEGAALDDFIATLKKAKIRRLIDVRELPLSRRKGFAKRALATALAEEGIEYIHLRGLGDPKSGRLAARQGNYSKFRKIFTRHMMSEHAKEDLKEAIKLLQRKHSCLMCFERNHENCHRNIVAEAIHAEMPILINHIEVTCGTSRQQSNQRS
jgi:hypothetical protein